MITVGFLTNLVAAIVMPTLPTYLESLGSRDYVNGWVLSATGVATAIANPILGFWSDRRGVKEVTLHLPMPPLLFLPLALRSLLSAKITSPLIHINVMSFLNSFSRDLSLRNSE